MKAVRVHPNTNLSAPYTGSNPAPSSALNFDSGLPIPRPSKTEDLLVRVEATAVVRDALTWPETYLREYPILGHDFSGTVVSVYDDSSDSAFRPGDEIYGMVKAERAGTWAEYALVSSEEACLKPSQLTWAEAAAVPLCGLTAYQALFDKAGVALPTLEATILETTDSSLVNVEGSKHRSLVTGAAGGVGIYAVQLAKMAGLYVVAATSSNERNGEFLHSLGADEVIEYDDMSRTAAQYHIIIDTLGGKPLEICWSLIKEDGVLVSIDSASYNFVEEHRKLGLSQGKDRVKALFFIVSPSKKGLQFLSATLASNRLKPFVKVMLPLADARKAYEQSATRSTRSGRTILTPW